MRCTPRRGVPSCIVNSSDTPVCHTLVKLVYCYLGFTKHILNHTNFFIFTTFSPINLHNSKVPLTFASHFKPKHISL